MKIYLAGPDVFLPDAVEVGQRKRELCRHYGFEGLYPLDNEIEPDADEPLCRSIFAGNVRMIREADILIANLTPFRGVSADVGTVFELGLAFALPKPVFGYSNVAAGLQQRVSSFLGDQKTTRGADGRIYGSDDFAIENFNLYDNLMVVEALTTYGHDVFIPGVPVRDPRRDLGAFESCLAWLAEARKGQRGAGARSGGEPVGIEPLQSPSSAPRAMRPAEVRHNPKRSVEPG